MTSYQIIEKGTRITHSLESLEREIGHRWRASRRGPYPIRVQATSTAGTWEIEYRP